jgi:hypothetical protein
MENKGLTLLDNIPQTSHTYLYLERWANGKEGSITDSNGHGVYRFFPMKRDANGNRIDEQTNFDDYETNPIVATGIIGYWLHYRRNNNRLASYTTWTKEDERKNTLKIFTDYTEDQLKQYIDREQDAPNGWRRDLEREFYTEFIIRNEKPLNKQTEALMEYITPSDRQMVRDVMAEYMLFLEEKRKLFSENVQFSKEKRTRLLASNTIVRTHSRTGVQTIDILQLYQFIERYFCGRLEHKYEWYALRRFLDSYDILLECDNSQFSEQMNHKDWFGSLDEKLQCSANEMNNYNFLNELTPGQWLEKEIPLGNRASKKAVARIYKTYSQLDLHKEKMVGR